MASTVFTTMNKVHGNPSVARWGRCLARRQPSEAHIRWAVTSAGTVFALDFAGGKMALKNCPSVPHEAESSERPQREADGPRRRLVAGTFAGDRQMTGIVDVTDG